MTQPDMPQNDEPVCTDEDPEANSGEPVDDGWDDDDTEDGA